MRRLVVGTFLSLDGVMQAPGGPEEDRSGGFDHGGWMVPFIDETGMKVMTEWVGRLDALVLGRKTYEIFAAHWPYVKDEGDVIATKFNSTKKYVASRTLDRLDWKGSTLLRGDVTDAIGELKRASGGELQIHGSGGLIQAILAHNLIDEFRIWIIPVLLGKGKRLFADGTVPEGLKLVETQTTSTGATLQVYYPAGKVKCGSFEFEEPTTAEIERRRKVESEEHRPAVAKM